MSLKDAVEFLFSRAASSPESIILDRGEDERTVLVQGRDVCEIKTFERAPDDFEHDFLSVDGFLDFLNGPLCEGAKGAVFVGDGLVVADLYRGSISRRRARLDLKVSEEYAALRKVLWPTKQDGTLSPWIEAKDLWRLLISDLDGCFPEGLLLAVKSLQLSKDALASAKISDLGVSDEASTSTVSVEFIDKGAEGKVNRPIGVAWPWNGRIFESFDYKSEIDCRLEVSAENGIGFIFHPRRLEERLREARAKLVDHIKGAVKAGGRFEVYEGTI